MPERSASPRGTAASIVVATNRFGLGARPGELAGAGDGAARLLAQLRERRPATDWQGLPDSLSLMRREYALRASRRRPGPNDPGQAGPGRRDQAMAAMPGEAKADGGPLRRELRDAQLAEFVARYRHAASTDAPFLERLTQFWSNHFAVSIDKGNARLYAAPMEREAIRPHVLGRFETLLLAVETHPAMLRYLDNAESIGDDSRAALAVARRGGDRRRGLNENLAREILELHTLGVDGGYAQADVTELARAITGWSTPSPRDFARGDAASAFVFRSAAHEPGSRQVLGRRYADDGVGQGRAVLADLARHPATARHLSLKLARHFVADDPPPELVERMARAYLDSAGELTALYRAMIGSEAAWSPTARKLKTPNDFLISAMRAGSIAPEVQAGGLLALLARLGQPLFTPRSPAGFPDTAADWGSADALWKRLQAAQALAARVASEAAPADLAESVLGEEAVRGDLAGALRRAGSPREGYALLFASPAFQWRA